MLRESLFNSLTILPIGTSQRGRAENVKMMFKKGTEMSVCWRSPLRNEKVISQQRHGV